MREGLAVIVVPGSRYGYSLTRIGWLKRVTGDEWEIEQSRVLMRRSWSAERQPFRDVAESKGSLKTGHFLDPSSKVPESLHRLQVTRVCMVPPEDYSFWVGLFPGLTERLGGSK